MDIPWNPAILEQRIGRIYRLGQKKNISVTNIVAENSIEQRMLAVLKFKSSVAEGILDNGEDSIFAGDDKFKKFMQSVEEIATLTPPVDPTVFDNEERQEITGQLTIGFDTGERGTDNTPQPLEDILESNEEELAATGVATSELPKPADLIQNGLTFLSQMMATLSNPEAARELTKSITEKDEKTGQTYLKIPVQNSEVIENALTLLSKLFQK
jgi:hypothetical protein